MKWKTKQKFRRSYFLTWLENGKDVIITLQQYIDNEVVCADSDYLWIISDKLDAHKYPYVIDGSDVVFAYDVQMNNLVNKTRISARKKFGFNEAERVSAR